MNPTETLIESVGDYLGACYNKVFGPLESEYPQIISASARIAHRPYRSKSSKDVCNYPCSRLI
jgi:hypothetical protein